MDKQPIHIPEYLKPLSKAGRIIEGVTHAIVLILSLALIVYISYDTFKGIPFLSNHSYMMFQFWVCLFFIFDFFLEFAYSPNKKRYLKNRWLFLLISIPYLNIITQYNITFSAHVLYYLRYVPLIRGCYSLAMVVGYISENRAVSLLTQYGVILASAVYMLAMLFYYEEYKINPDVKGFWDALYWASMNMTTVGCYFSAVTVPGKVISVILPILGMMMLPLFTVYVTDMVQKKNQENLEADQVIDKAEEAASTKKDDPAKASAPSTDSTTDSTAGPTPPSGQNS